jgi:hypothetical protein
VGEVPLSRGWPSDQTDKSQVIAKGEDLTGKIPGKCEVSVGPRHSGFTTLATLRGRGFGTLATLASVPLRHSITSVRADLAPPILRADTRVPEEGGICVGGAGTRGTAL